MSSSTSDFENFNLFSSLRLEPPVKIQPVKESLRSNKNNDVDLILPSASTGYKWKVTSSTRFWRFVYLSCENGHWKAYNSNEDTQFPAIPWELAIGQLIADGRGLSLISTVHDLASKDNPRLWNVLSYTLAVCACSDKRDVKQQVFQLLSQILTHPLFLLQFIYHYERLKKASCKSSGMSKGVRAAISDWYSNKRTYDVAFAVTACSSYKRWKHKQLLRMVHIKPGASLAAQILCAYITYGYKKTKEDFEDRVNKSEEADVTKLMELLDAVTRVKRCEDSKDTDSLLLIAKHRLHWGHIPHSLLRSCELWKTSVYDAPLDALLPKLPLLHDIKLFTHEPSCMDTLVNRLKDEKEIASSRLHPFSFLWHRSLYAKGESSKKNRKWEPEASLKAALDTAFYLALQNVTATGKRICVTVDASSSMKGNIVKSNCLDCLTVAAALLLILGRTEKNPRLQAFSKTLQPIPIEKEDTVETVKAKISEVALGGTDCSRPLIDAKKNDQKFDCFVVITDKETWHGVTKPSDALVQYREKTKIAAKLLVVALMSKGFTVADPNDAGMLDICGFAEGTPDVISAFISGKF